MIYITKIDVSSQRILLIKLCEIADLKNARWEYAFTFKFRLSIYGIWYRMVLNLWAIFMSQRLNLFLLWHVHLLYHTQNTSIRSTGLKSGTFVNRKWRHNDLNDDVREGRGPEFFLFMVMMKLVLPRLYVYKTQKITIKYNNYVFVFDKFRQVCVPAYLEYRPNLILTLKFKKSGVGKFE